MFINKMKVFFKLFLIILIPLSCLWSWIYRIRRFLYNNEILKKTSFMVPIISVGNVTFGGTGKTPFVIWLCEYLNQLDKKVMILMRGYKGEFEHSSALLKGNRKLGHNPDLYGDEALMLVRRLQDTSIIVGKKRSQNLEYYFSKENPDVVVLDDGHQHINLDRSLNIVLFDALMPVEKYKVAPWGYLREGLSALQDADLVIINRSDLVSSTELSELKKIIRPHLRFEVPIGEMGYKVNGLFDINFKETILFHDIKDKKVICVAGIASPASFFIMVEQLGCQIVDKIIYPDHFAYAMEDVDHIVERASKLDALVITTEKDIIKLKRLDKTENFHYLGVAVYFLRGENYILDAIKRVCKN